MLTKKILKPATIKRKLKTIKSLVKHGVNINNPDSVVAFINTCDWASGTKDITMNAYRDYIDMLGLTSIKLPHIRRENKLPFIPLEKEIDMLIAGVSFKVATFLRLLKDTACRPIEAWSLKWNDIDFPTKNVTIRPAKYSKPRRLKLSEQTLNMSFSLSRRNVVYLFSPTGKSERFSEELEHFARNFTKQRNRIALKLKNPRVRQISLRTFRHWKAAIEYARTKDIVHVKEMLGHVNVNNTLKYVHIANALANNEDSYICRAVASL